MKRFVAVKKTESKDCQVFTLYQNEDCEKVLGFMEYGDLDGQRVVFIHLLGDIIPARFHSSSLEMRTAK